MSKSEDKLEDIKNELQWINLRDDFYQSKNSNVHFMYKILVPAGVLVTAGVLGTGLYYMVSRNSKKQQSFMRYRVLAQGITIAIAALGIFHVKLSS